MVHPPSLRVVHAVLSLDVGGLERMVLCLIRGGLQLNQDITILCIERPGTLAEEAKALGAKVISLSKPAGYLTEFIARAEKELRLIKPDVVHTHQIGALLYAGQAARRSDVPVVVHTEHTDHLGNTKGLFRKLKNRWIWHKAAWIADRFCCVSADIMKSAARWNTIPYSKMEVIRNGIDVDAFTDRSCRDEIRQTWKIPLDAPLVCTVGRLNEVKRQDVLLRGVAEARKKISNLHAILVGDGPERASLESLTRELNLESAVHFAGYQSKPEQFLAASDMFALTSRQEGLPMAILEAWATGLPVICSNVGGIPHLMLHKENGLLFPSLDHIALSECIVRLVRDTLFARQMADAGRSLVHEKYSLKVMTKDYEELYRQLLPARKLA